MSRAGNKSTKASPYAHKVSAYGGASPILPPSNAQQEKPILPHAQLRTSKHIITPRRHGQTRGCHADEYTIPLSTL